MLRLIRKTLCRLFARRARPQMYELTCCHAGRYEGYMVFVYHFRYADDDRYVPHVTDSFQEENMPGPSVFADSGCYDTCRAAYLAAKMQIDELCGFGVPRPLGQ